MTLDKVSLETLKGVLPQEDYSEIKKATYNEGIFVIQDPSYDLSAPKSDVFVGLEVTLRKGKRIGLLRD
jgi:hypothetical protein